MRKVYIVMAYKYNIMQLSQTELKVLEQVSYGNNKIENIAQNIHRSNSQIYRAKQNLLEHGFLHLNRGRLEPEKSINSALILNLISRYPSLIKLFSDSGLRILISILKPKSINEIMQETNLKKSTIYKKIKIGRNISAIEKNKNHKYTINEKIWPNLKNYLQENKKFEEAIDNRIPVNSIIYHKNEDEILFSNNSELKATPTAFSVYEKYKIKILLPTNFYYLPNKNLSKEEILLHSIYITNKEKDYRYLTYVALFYIKFRCEFIKIKSPILKNFDNILKGNKIERYPTLDEIKEKAELYDIKI
jgi:predicted transcriptional regulator